MKFFFCCLSVRCYLFRLAKRTWLWAKSNFTHRWLYTPKNCSPLSIGFTVCHVARTLSFIFVGLLLWRFLCFFHRKYVVIMKKITFDSMHWIYSCLSYKLWWKCNKRNITKYENRNNVIFVKNFLLQSSVWKFQFFFSLNILFHCNLNEIVLEFWFEMFWHWYKITINHQ